MKRLSLFVLLVASLALSLACGGEKTPPPVPTPVPTAVPEPTPVPTMPPVPVACVQVPGPGGAGNLWRGDCAVTTTCHDRGDGLYAGDCHTK